MSALQNVDHEKIEEDIYEISKSNEGIRKIPGDRAALPGGISEGGTRADGHTFRSGWSV